MHLKVNFRWVGIQQGSFQDKWLKRSGMLLFSLRVYLEQQRAICILAVLRKLALKICCCTVHIQVVGQYFWWYSTVEHLHQWTLLLVGSWCSKDHFDTKTSFWPKMQIVLCCSDPSSSCSSFFSMIVIVTTGTIYFLFMSCFVLLHQHCTYPGNGYHSTPVYQRENYGDLRRQLDYPLMSLQCNQVEPTLSNFIDGSLLYL